MATLIFSCCAHIYKTHTHTNHLHCSSSMNVNQLKNLHKLSIHCVIFDKVKTLANMSNQISINTKIEFAPLAKSVKSYYKGKGKGTGL